MAVFPAILVGGPVFTGPTADGSAGNPLITDGSGNVSFASGVTFVAGAGLDATITASGQTRLFVASSSGTANIQIDAGASSQADFTWKKGGSNKWVERLTAGDDDWKLYSYGASTDVLVGDYSTGNWSIPAGTLSISGAEAAEIPLSVELHASQSGNALEVNTNGGSGGDIFYISSGGNLRTDGQLTVGAREVYLGDNTSTSRIYTQGRIILEGGGGSESSMSAGLKVTGFRDSATVFRLWPWSGATTSPIMRVHDDSAGTTQYYSIDFDGSQSISPAALTSGGTDDYALSIARTLNDSGAAGGSDTFRALKINVTETDTTGWDDVYLLDAQVGGTSRCYVTSQKVHLSGVNTEANFYGTDAGESGKEVQFGKYGASVSGTRFGVAKAGNGFYQTNAAGVELLFGTVGSDPLTIGTYDIAAIAIDISQNVSIPNGTLSISGAEAAEVPLSVELHASQSGNAFEINTNGGSGGDVLRVDSDGDMRLARNLQMLDGFGLVSTNNTANIGICGGTTLDSAQGAFCDFAGNSHPTRAGDAEFYTGQVVGAGLRVYAYNGSSHDNVLDCQAGRLRVGTLLERSTTAGHRVTIWTARGTTTGKAWRSLTESQLARWGVRYHKLMMGKPFYHVFIDDRAHPQP